MNIFLIIIQIIFIPLLSPLIIGIIRKFKAKMQMRRGASIFQPYADLRKLFKKDEVISRDASWIFLFAPYIIFGVTMAVGLSLPIFSTTLTNHLTGDFLVIIYLLAISTFFLTLAGLDTGNAFGGFGSSREMTISALAEGGFIFSLFTLSIIAHSTSLGTIAQIISIQPLTSFLPIILAFIGFILVMMAETGRFPFDNPSTHLELTMIHEAMILEYSGKRLALIEWAAANKLLIFLTLGANLFFPWGIATSISFPVIGLAILLYIIKILVLALGIALLESVIAKYRFFRLPSLLFTSFVICLVAIVMVLN